MRDYLVFATQADANAAMRQINDFCGFSDPHTMTVTWATIETRATDGKSVFQAPPEERRVAITVPYTIEASRPDWFPTPEQLPA